MYKISKKEEKQANKEKEMEVLKKRENNDENNEPSEGDVMLKDNQNDLNVKSETKQQNALKTKEILQNDSVA